MLLDGIKRSLQSTEVPRWLKMRLGVVSGFVNKNFLSSRFFSSKEICNRMGIRYLSSLL